MTEKAVQIVSGVQNKPLLIMINYMFLRPVVLTALKVALFVGTVLALINHGPALLAMALSREQVLQIALTYVVPYAVSTYSSVKILQNQSDRPHNPNPR
jgi:hypothetical protein